MLAPAMPQYRVGHAIDMLRFDVFRAFERRERTRRAQHHEIGSQAVDVGRNAQLAHVRMHDVIEIELIERRARRFDAFGERRLIIRVLCAKCFGVRIECESCLDDPLAHISVEAVREFDGKPEAIQQLRAQFPSSGFMVPISTNRASCRCDMPSRSMIFTPLAATSSS